MKERKIAEAKWLFPALGLLAVLLGNLPLFLLREGIVFPMRDQLDGEIVAYFLGGKYFLSGTSFYPEYMGGVAATALVPPAKLLVLFFALLPPLYAFILSNVFMMVFGFLGMYLWGSRLGACRPVAAAVGILFAFLPFYPVYGLCMAGIPLAAWAFSVLAAKEESRRSCILAYLSIILYGAASSLVLCGYAVLAVLGLLWLCMLAAGRRFEKAEKLRFLSGIVLLTAVYCIEFRELIAQILGGGAGYVSNKSEYIIYSSPFLKRFGEVFLHGELVENMHGFILAEVLIALCIALAVRVLGKKKDTDPEVKKLLQTLTVFFVTILLIALFAALYRTEAVTAVLNRMSGAVKAFQVDRFSWMLPFLWYSCLALVLTLLLKAVKQTKAAAALVILCLLPCAFTVLMGSAFKENAMELVRTNSTALSWNGFFGTEQFSEVASFIEETEGMTRENYRVGCLGIEPSVAVLNGFYTIDGYSNNYDVEYKHRFRKVIAAELEKNEYNKAYFDYWGNRCYLFAAGYDGNVFLSKYTYPHFDDLDLDTAALKDLGCRYLLSAGEIAGAEERGLALLNVFDRSDFTYYVYLYKVN